MNNAKRHTVSRMYQHYRKKYIIFEYNIFERELCNINISIYSKNFTSKVSLRTCTENIRIIFYIFIDFTFF